MFLNDSKIINSVMFPHRLKGSKDSVFDYETTNAMPFFWVVLRSYQRVVLLQRKYCCYCSQRLTSRTDYFMNAWVKAGKEDFFEARVSFETRITQQVAEPFLLDSPWILTEVYRSFSQLHPHCVVWHELQKWSISILPFAPDARGDTSKELIFTIYSLRCITLVNPLH